MTGKSLLLFLLLTIASTSGYAQGEIDKQKDVFYRDESSWAAMLSSNGYGLNYTYNKRIDAFNWHSFGIDFSEIKSRKEYRTSPSVQGRKFAYGKINYVYSLRFNYGKNKEIYSKYDAGGIAIRRFYSISGTLGIKKPIYYYYYIDEETVEIRELDLNASILNIYDNAPYQYGLENIAFVPGASVKFGYNFDFSKAKKQIHAVEVGAIADVFMSNVNIMATNPQFYYVGFYAAYRYGKVVDKSYIDKE
ncbi:MAG TPA: hypothetical protein DCQ31_16500 [Bacteroidales bacterium]|nr:hypothetical protein [Bacteroidales bacterium]